MSGFALSIDSYRNSDVNYLTSPENVKLRRDLMRGLDRARARTNSARLPIDAVTMQLMDDTGFWMTRASVDSRLRFDVAIFGARIRLSATG